MELRPYQQQAIDNILAEYNDGNNKLLMSMATGLGKTVLFSRLAKDHFISSSKKVLVVAHREELLNQALEKFKMVDKDLCCFIDQGGKKLSPMEYMNAHVILASVQTIGRAGTERIQRYDPDDFSAVIIDEAHRSLAQSYIRVFEYFGISKHPPLDEKNSDVDWNKKCLLLGVTATPMRTKNGESLKFAYDKLVYKYDLITAIQDGWLANIHNLVAATNINLGEVKTSNGDFQISDLASKVNTEGRNEFIVSTYLEKAQPGPTLVFAVDTDHNKALAERFNDRGVECKIIDGNTPKKERAEILEKFKEGDIPVLVNCMVLTEGFDAPNIRNILMARPTKSTIFYIQAIGRGTRLADGKDKVTVIDFVDNISKHDPLTLKYIVGIPEGKKTAKAKEIEDLKEELERLDEVGADILEEFGLDSEADYRIIDQGLILDLTQFIKENYIEKSRYTWFKILENEWFLPFPNYTEFVTKKGKQKYYSSRLKAMKGWDEIELWFEAITMTKQKIKSKIGSYNTARQLDARVKGLIIQNDIYEGFLAKGGKWKQDKITDGQKKYILGLLNEYKLQGRELDMTTDDLDIINKGDAGLLINILKYETKA